MFNPRVPDLLTVAIRRRLLQIVTENVQYHLQIRD